MKSCDLEDNQQSVLIRMLQAPTENNGFRVIASSRYCYEYLAAQKTLMPEIADFWRQAIAIPSLDEHIEDIPELLEYYVNWFGEQEQLPYRHFGVAAQNLLRNYHWRGDISQLKQFIKICSRK